MVTVSHVAHKLVNDKLFLQEAINHGVVSYNSLATKLQPEIEEELGRKVKHSAVTMALRRYDEKIKKSTRDLSFNYFVESIMKSNICYIVISETPSLLPKLLTLYHFIDFKKGGILNIVQGNHEVGVVTNERHKEKLLDILKMERILNVIEDLVCLSLMYSKDFTFTPGVIYNVSRFLAWENINIVNILQTQTELSLVVSKKDAMKCYKTLEKLVKKTKEGKTRKLKI